MRVQLCFAVLIMMCFGEVAHAQFQQGDPGGAKTGDTRVQRFQAGLIVQAHRGPCRGIVGTAPVPTDWPEQQVKIVEEDISSSAKVSYKMVGGTVKQMVVRIPYLPGGEESKALVTFEITRSSQVAPDDTDQYVLPDLRKLNRTIRKYLGPSPYIESRHAKIRSLAKTIGTDAETDWERVEAIYDWVRTEIEYKNGPLKGALAALKDGTGDCEELTSLFIAICRASNIPARTVWVPGHCYPEFYLEDKDGKGHWFPCQAAGSRAFGGIPEHRPILQKGDDFRSPHNRREHVRYLPGSLIGVPLRKGGDPRVKFVPNFEKPG